MDFPGETLEGKQVNERKEKAGTTVTVDVAVDDPREAVMVPDCWAVTLDVLTEKPAALAPSATVTEPGVFTAEELSVRETKAPPAGAAADSETVHAAPDPPTTLEGVHWTDEMESAVPG